MGKWLYFKKYMDECTIDEIKQKRKESRIFTWIYAGLSFIFWIITLIQYLWIGYVGLTVWFIFIPITLIVAALTFKTYEGQASLVLSLKEE